MYFQWLLESSYLCVCVCVCECVGGGAHSTGILSFCGAMCRAGSWEGFHRLHPTYSPPCLWHMSPLLHNTRLFPVLRARREPPQGGTQLSANSLLTGGCLPDGKLLPAFSHVPCSLLPAVAKGALLTTKKTDRKAGAQVGVFWQVDTNIPCLEEEP